MRNTNKSGLFDMNGVEIKDGDVYSVIDSEELYEVRFLYGAYLAGLLGTEDSEFTPLGFSIDEDGQLLSDDKWLSSKVAVVGNAFEMFDSLEDVLRLFYDD